MRRLGILPSLLLVAALLVGCGEATPSDSNPQASDTRTPQASDTTSPATDQPSTPPTSTPPTKSPPITPGGVPFELVEIVSGTAGRGQVSPGAVPLDTPEALDHFVAGFSSGLADDVRRAVEGADDAAGPVYGAVVGLGCDVPPGVVVTRTSTGYAVVGRKVPDPTPECFAAVTSVAVVSIRG